MKAIDVLRKARTRIENPEHWTHDGEFAFNGVEACEPWSPRADCWCSLGAVLWAIETLDESAAALYANRQHHPIYDECVQLLVSGLADGFSNYGGNEDDVASFNDFHAEHSDILNLFDHAIATGAKGEALPC